MHTRFLTTALVFSLACNVWLLTLLFQKGTISLVPVTQESVLPSSLTQTPYTTPARLGRVVDGDTLLVSIGTTTEYVRLIGINAPEENKNNNTPPECFAEQASEYLRSLTKNVKELSLVFDESQGKRDKYDRLLAYVLLPDNTDLGEVMIQEGFAEEYTYKKYYARRDLYRQTEEKAKNEEKGVWKVCKK